MIRCDSGADSEEGRCLRSLDEKRRVYDRNMDRYVSVISWDDLCAAGGVSSGGFLFFHCYFVLPRERLVTQSAAPLYAKMPADSLNALRLNERNPQGRTVRFSRLFH